jgi:hypothetical protein
MGPSAQRSDFIFECVNYTVSINNCGIEIGFESLPTFSPEIEEYLSDLRYATPKTNWFYWLPSLSKLMLTNKN